MSPQDQAESYGGRNRLSTQLRDALAQYGAATYDRSVRAFVIAVGSELLGTDRLDTNSLRLAACLRRHGATLVGKSVAGDSLTDVAHHLQGALLAADVVVMTGGLGPTTDDLTRQAVAALLQRNMSEDESIVEEIKERFRGFGMEMPQVNRRQAMVIEGATVLSNRRGTAPGLQLEYEGGTIFLMPGVPVELEHMIETHLDAWLAAQSVGARLATRSLKIACRSESAVEEALEPLYESFEAAEITVLASAGDIELRFTVHGAEAETAPRLDAMRSAALRALGRAVYAEESDTTLEQTVGKLLSDAGRTVVTAESCTGGLIAERLTDVAGSSAYFLGSVVTYSDELKVSLLGVPEDVLQSAGAVSETVAIEMATRARRLLGADYAIATTGIAGPGGGSTSKPVGTVHVAICGPGDGRRQSTDHRRLSLPGDRDRVRRLTSQWALELLRRRLAGPGVPP